MDKQRLPMPEMINDDKHRHKQVRSTPATTCNQGCIQFLSRPSISAAKNFFVCGSSMGILTATDFDRPK